MYLPSVPSYIVLRSLSFHTPEAETVEWHTYIHRCESVTNRRAPVDLHEPNHHCIESLPLVLRSSTNWLRSRVRTKRRLASLPNIHSYRTVYQYWKTIQCLWRASVGGWGLAFFCCGPPDSTTTFHISQLVCVSQHVLSSTIRQPRPIL